MHRIINTAVLVFPMNHDKCHSSDRLVAYDDQTIGVFSSGVADGMRLATSARRSDVSISTPTDTPFLHQMNRSNILR